MFPQLLSEILAGTKVGLSPTRAHSPPLMLALRWEGVHYFHIFEFEIILLSILIHNDTNASKRDPSAAGANESRAVRKNATF